MAGGGTFCLLLLESLFRRVVVPLCLVAGESPSVFVFLWGVRTSKVPVVLSYELILTDQIIILITDIF